MADLRLAAIDPIRTTTESVAWGQRNGSSAYQRQPQRREKDARARLVAMLAPSREPETCEVDYVVDGEGMMVAILVRDLTTGEVIARIQAEDLWRLASEEAAGGLLVERRG
ncbi:MAG TPA: hypothetical protein PJ994_01010 [Tepidiformaceae bacterium]|nr:hypothetical protein [Tepidiformaceae bacterium]HMO96112.1 hypothetical protein [Tepidiformaceae bacterium]